MWFVFVIVGIKCLIDNISDVQMQSQALLAPSNLFYLYLSMFTIKMLHEFGHAFAVRRFGGQVHTMGLMFLIFNPLPYMDAGAAWSFRSKWKRAFVGAAGMVFEIFTASCAMLVWANTGEGLVHSLAYNIMFIASVSTILFNINPLLKFDGYYILSDLLDIPNLHQQARRHITNLAERFLFGCENTFKSGHNLTGEFWLTAFGILSSVYKMFVSLVIILFVADHYLLLGIIMAMAGILTWIINPVINLIRYLSTSTNLNQKRRRAITICSGTLIAFLGFFLYFPIPCSFKAPGVLQAVEYNIPVNKINGRVIAISGNSGKHVNAGDTLLILENQELTFEIERTQAALRETQTRYLKAMQEIQADLQPISSRIDYYTKQLEQLNQNRDELIVKAEISGSLVAQEIKNCNGMWLPRGTAIGQIINTKRYYFTSAVSEQDVSQLFSNRIISAVVRLSGQTNQQIEIDSFTSIPMEQTDLPSSSLGWNSGGDIAVDLNDRSGRTTSEPFYEVRAFVNNTTGASLKHGLSGKIKFNLPDESFSQQSWRKFRQLVQKRYQI
jgi:putative peptide zinc metalloprotease protein